MSSIAGANPRVVRLLSWILVLSTWFTSDAASHAADSLHTQIDQLSDAVAVGPRGVVVDDLTFLRRVTLDLTGRIPSIVNVREFLANKSPDKRARAIDRLMSSPNYFRHLAVVRPLSESSGTPRSETVAESDHS